MIKIKSKNRLTTIERQRGFSLLEAMIAMVIFSIALLGLAAMYAQTVKLSHGAYLRSVASIQVMDAADSIRASILMDKIAGTDTLDAEFTCDNASSSKNCDEESCNPQEYIDWAAEKWCEQNDDLFGSLFQGAEVEEDGDDYLITFEWLERDPEREKGLVPMDFEYRIRL